MSKAQEKPHMNAFTRKVEEIKKSNPRLSEGEVWGLVHQRYPGLYAAARQEGVS